MPPNIPTTPELYRFFKETTHKDFRNWLPRAWDDRILGVLASFPNGRAGRKRTGNRYALRSQTQTSQDCHAQAQEAPAQEPAQEEREIVPGDAFCGRPRGCEAGRQFPSSFPARPGFPETASGCLRYKYRGLFCRHTSSDTRSRNPGRSPRIRVPHTEQGYSETIHPGEAS